MYTLIKVGENCISLLVVGIKLLNVHVVGSVPYCTVLYCTALHCTVLYCTVLYCTVLYWSLLYLLYSKDQP
jgi:hypothetical protein